MAINPTDKDIGRKVVWYPELESTESWRNKTKDCGDAAFGIIVHISGAQFGLMPFNAIVHGFESDYWAGQTLGGMPCEWQALDWADDL